MQASTNEESLIGNSNTALATLCWSIHPQVFALRALASSWASGIEVLSDREKIPRWSSLRHGPCPLFQLVVARLTWLCSIFASRRAVLAGALAQLPAAGRHTAQHQQFLPGTARDPELLSYSSHQLGAQRGRSAKHTEAVLLQIPEGILLPLAL